MPAPKPPVPIDGACSVIYDNTLYVYTPEAFLSLPLEEDAKWKKLDMGESVTGAVCVGSAPTNADQAGLFIVGGTGGADDYTGLQKFTYSSNNWTTITPTSQPMKNRQYHGAAYMQADDVIVMYGGAQDGSKAPSSDSFSIGASEPYVVDSPAAQSQSPPPLIQPIILPWTIYDSIMIGGDPGNQKVSLFNKGVGWRPFGTTLSQGLAKDRSSMDAVLVDGDDGSKSLYVFDVSVSPNTVERIVLQDASGMPVLNSAPVSEPGLDSDLNPTKRGLTLDKWPKYNSKSAPDAVRQNFAIASDDNGMIVFSGGNDKDPISIFDGKKNKWADASNFFSGNDRKVESVSKSSSTKKHHSTTATSTKSTTTTFSTSISSTASTTEHTTAATTSTDAAVAAGNGKSDDDDGLGSNVILGITLGSIFGLLLFLGLILLLLRRRKQRQNHAEVGHARRASGMPSDEKDPRGMANGTQLKPPGSPGYYRGHQAKGSADSYSSMAILMGRMGQQKTSLTRKPSHGSDNSSVSSIHKQFKSTISKPYLHANDTPDFQSRPRGSPTPGAGPAQPRPRNKAADPQDGMRRSSGWNRYWSGGSALQMLGFGGGGSKRDTEVSESSRYSESTTNMNPRVTQDSATVPPLNFEGRASMNRVNSGSPVVAQHPTKVPIREGMTGKIERSPSKASSGYSSGIPESVNEAWDPTSANKPWGTDRAPSSAYSANQYYGSSLAASHAGARDPPPGVSKQPQLAMAATSSDMSWLNLGDRSRSDL